MADVRSPLADATPIRRDALEITEIVGRDLLQLAGWPTNFGRVAAKLGELVDCPVPSDTRTAAARDVVTLFRVGPERLWIAAPSGAISATRLQQAFAADEAVMTELGHVRIVLRVVGPTAPELLGRCVAVDLDPTVFAPGASAQTPLHQVGVLLHRVGDDAFELYVPRSYALSIWDWLSAIV